MISGFPDTGKIQEDFLKIHVFPSTGAVRQEVVSGPQYGVDVSVIALHGGQSLVTATDPATLIPTLGLQESAWLTVHLVASDVATAGCLPQYAQFCLNLPETLTATEFHSYWNHISTYCDQLGVAITGGHTGRIAGQNSTISGGVTMMSTMPSEEVLLSRMARPGDSLILVKEPAIISTAILALSFPETVLSKCGKEVLEAGQALFYESSAVDAAMSAISVGIHSEGVRAIHDITEGGVMGAIWEMMTAAGCGVQVDVAAIPRGYAQDSICGAFGVDPFCSVGAGALLLAVAPGRVSGIINQLHQDGHQAVKIGEVTEEKAGRWLAGEVLSPLTPPGVDPYWAAFLDALNRGWK